MDTGRQRQTHVYMEGMAGARPLLPVDMTELEKQARRSMSPEAFAYVAGGAGLESTLRVNSQAF